MRNFFDNWEAQIILVVITIALFFAGLVLTKNSDTIVAIVGWLLLVVPPYFAGKTLWKSWTKKNVPELPAPPPAVEDTVH